MEPKQNLDLNPFLEEERIRKIQEKLFDYSRKFGGRFPEDDEAHARYLIKKYSVNTSVLMGVLEDQVVEKRIVEVGPGFSGMEKLSEAFDSEDVDLINIMSMYPDPCPLEIKRAQEFGNLFQRIRANRYYKRYPSMLSDEINRVLKTTGYLLLWSRPYSDDFRLNPSCLNKKGFSHQTIKIPKNIMPVEFDVDIY